MSCKADLDGYQAKLDPLVRELVDKLHKVIIESVPDLDEVIKWGMICVLTTVEDFLFFRYSI